jgi:tetratricopeptide (TPR) repeat protein
VLRNGAIVIGWIATSLTVLAVDGASAKEWGDVHFQISCDQQVQSNFDRAVAMLHSYSFQAASKTIGEVLKDDPNCAMGYWGLAASTMGSLFAGRTGPGALGKGWEYIQKAKEIGAKTDREQGYIEAAELFFQDADNTDQHKRLQAYSDALEQLHRKYPDDLEAEVFYGYAVTALAPPSDKTYAYELKGADILKDALAKNPNHPGALHYLIHAYDHTPIASEGLKAAQAYAAVAPSSPHALHIPSHIFVRLGLWNESVKTNIAGANVDDLFFKTHAMDFLVHSYLELAQDREAKKVLDELNAFPSIGVVHLNVAYALAAIPSRYAIERRRWDEAANLPLPRSNYPWKKFPQAEALMVFARGIGAARMGNYAAARNDMNRLEKLHVEFAKLKGDAFKEYWLTEIGVNRQMIGAWISFEQGNVDEALSTLRRAADDEDASERDPVVPGAILSARELLGELLLQTGKPNEALEAFEADLKSEPGRYWSLYGAARSAEQAGDRDRAGALYAKLITQTKNADGDRPELAVAKKYLDGAGG